MKSLKCVPLKKTLKTKYITDKRCKYRPDVGGRLKLAMFRPVSIFLYYFYLEISFITLIKLSLPWILTRTRQINFETENIFFSKINKSTENYSDLASKADRKELNRRSIVASTGSGEVKARLNIKKVVCSNVSVYSTKIPHGGKYFALFALFGRCCLFCFESC